MVIYLGFLSFQKAAGKTWQGHVVIEWVSQRLLRSQVDGILLAPGGSPGYGSLCHPATSVPSPCIPVACAHAHDSPIKWQKHEQKCDQTASTSPVLQKCRLCWMQVSCAQSASKGAKDICGGRCPIVMVPQTLNLWISYIYQKETGH